MIISNKDSINTFLSTQGITFFTPQEFNCKCGCGDIKIDTDLLIKLNKLRTELNTPITINSAFRCALHNKTIGGVQSSKHLLGEAADITVKDFKDNKELIIKIAKRLGFSGIGIHYDTFVHLDVRQGSKVVF